MIENVAALVVFLVPLAYSPGPGNMFFAAIGARFGTRASIAASAGYHLATWIVTFAVGYGFAEVFTRYPAVFTAMKYAGSAYMLWLAVKFLRAGVTTGAVEAVAAGFWDGVILLVLNPKAYVIMALMFSQFLGVTSAEYLVQLLIITSVFTLNNFVAFLVWTMLGDGLARVFRTERDARILNMVFGGLLAGVAVWMLFR